MILPKINSIVHQQTPAPEPEPKPEPEPPKDEHTDRETQEVHAGIVHCVDEKGITSVEISPKNIDATGENSMYLIVFSILMLFSSLAILKTKKKRKV